MDEILAIPASEAHQVWPHVERWIGAAAEPAGYTPEYVLAQIETANMQLWWGERCACVTQVHTLPLWRVLVIVLLGGENMESWLEDLLTTLEEWGRQIEARYIECHGRKGWKRVGRDLGYEPMWQTLRKEL